MKKRNKRRQNTKFYRLNERIFAGSLRVLDFEGKQIGILSKNDALEKARQEGMDLVEIAPLASPPVARIVDFKKFLYQEEKKRREEKKKTKSSETKEVRLGPFMNDHDLNVMVGRAREFLGDNNKVKLVVRFTGRQMAHPEFGHQMLEKALGMVSDLSKVDKEKHFEGRQLITLLSPDKKSSVKTQAEEENEEVQNEEKN